MEPLTICAPCMLYTLCMQQACPQGVALTARLPTLCYYCSGATVQHIYDMKRKPGTANLRQVSA